MAGIFFFIYCFGFQFPFHGTPFDAQRHGNPPLTPAWALECWLWEDDVNSAQRVDTLLEGYAKYDIPVRTILLDSPWSMRYNDFQVDTLRYPHPKEWFGELQDKGYRVVLWMTSLIDSKSKDTRVKDSGDWFRDAKEKGYLAGKGGQINWWKGKGGFIDYTNPKAVKWWHGLQQTMFDYGIDGWKLDMTCTLFWTQIGRVPFLYKTTHKGVMTTRGYMDHYYREEYQHGLTQNPEFVTLARAIDRGFHPEGYAPIDAAPVTWVGDQKHTWQSAGKPFKEDTLHTDIASDGEGGIEMALQNILASATVGYNIIGSDVAGYSGNTIPPRLYMRWVELSAFCGLFLNGGHGERALWDRSPQELEIIRKYSWLHTELIPYIYSYVVTGHEGGTILQRPVNGKYHYLFGDDFFVAPIYRDQLSNEVKLPKGNWRYFFNDKELIKGPVSFKRDFPLDEYPVYIREGSIVPMNIERRYTGLGSEANKGCLTWLIYPGVDNQFTVYHPDKRGSSTVIMVNRPETIEITLKDTKKPSILNIHLDKKPGKVSFDGVELSDLLDYNFDVQKSRLIVRFPDIEDGVLTIVK
ncbi:MAG TPA: glycoside hydrolase [Prolixibacteraceae bacterium]|jgi:alpha-D-xyloside xylohydrolase|nr:glycoside hydrolase [Prolixibacteraceae bacterium]